MALRLRRSPFMAEYFRGQEGEEEEMGRLLEGLGKKSNAKNKKQKIERG